MRRWRQIRRRKPDAPSALSKALCRRLMAAGLDLPAGEDGYFIKRTYAGRHQLSAGAWRWMLVAIAAPAGGHFYCGSQWTVAEIMKAEFIEISTTYHGDTEVDVATKGPDRYRKEY